MRILLVPSSFAASGDSRPQNLTSFLVNETVAIDAGSLGLFGTADEQARIRHVFISHTHIDHVATLPIFLDNVYDPAREPVTVHGSAETLDGLQRNLFNGCLWPDFIALSRKEPLLRLSVVQPGVPVVVDGLKVTPVPVHHVVPTLGFIIEDERAAVIIPGDTGPTTEIWERANRTPNVKALFLEVTFPNKLRTLADTAKHLVPATFLQEMAKLKHGVRVIAVHLKTSFMHEIEREMASSRIELVQPGKWYVFE